MSVPQPGGVPDNGTSLESRLRGLILNNGLPAPANIQEALSVSVPSLPPHMKGASLAEQQAFFDRQAAVDGSTTSLPESVFASAGGRKRLNQAQRRQMNTQLSNSFNKGQNPQNPLIGGNISPAGFPTQSRHQEASSIFGRHQGQEGSTHFRNASQQPYHSHHYNQRHVPSTHEQHGFANRSIDGLMAKPYADSRGTNAQPFTPQPSSYGSQYGARNPAHNRQLYQPGLYSGNARNTSFVRHEDLVAQSSFLQALAENSIPLVGIDDAGVAEKERFRALVEQACREAISEHEQKTNPKFPAASVELRCFGSMASGYATRGSDMDLALLTPLSDPPADSSDSPVPRILERKLLDMGLGARLLTRTRIPIIKLCQRPTEKLFADLLEERLRWENGFEADDAEQDEEALDKSTNAGGAAIQSTDELDSVGASKVDMSRLVSLEQKPRETLGDYYGNAKRLLRQLGGRDATTAAGYLEPDEINILVDVCKAFINGLHDQELKSRLFTYQSLSFDLKAEPHTVRSLSGVFSQIEGERLAMSWDQRPLPEASENREIDGFRQIEDWHKLCDAVSLDTMVFGRLLHVAVDKLRHMSSLQLVNLEQGSSEDPAQYSSRAAKILSELGENPRLGPEIDPSAIIVARYIAGIRNTTTQEQLIILKEQKGLTTLRSVTAYHRMLQLANDYEKSLSAKVYPEDARCIIEQYIDRVRKGHDIPSSTLKSLLLLHEPVQSRRNGNSRDRYYDRLEFPKHNIGVQCDINFAAQLAIHNTQLLRCYSACDPRVRPMILFVKQWAKRRNINTPYRGTLSSYGYVLMVLHYLVNIATPFVCPNLQLLKRDPPAYIPPEEAAAQTTCLGRDVQFWRNEREIKGLSERGMLNHNKESIGMLLRGFFEYYAQVGQMSTGIGRGFDWGREVLSLRTAGGIVSKQQKGWVGARTTTETTIEAAPVTKDVASVLLSSPSNIAADTAPAAESAPGDSIATTVHEVKQEGKKRIVKEETKEIRHRYLFAVEDPFELDHNVARTVTHNGIVSIRDEFRRAWRLIRNGGRPGPDGKKPEGLMDDVVGDESASKTLKQILEEIHGKFDSGNLES